MPQAPDDRLRRLNTRPVAASRAREHTLAVAVVPDTGVRSPVAVTRLAELAREALAAEKVKRAMVSITLVTSRTMATLNQRHLGHRGPTDVITFAMGKDPSGTVIADIYICPDVARMQAREHGAGVREELARLVVHGVLHACGHEHPEDNREASRMWRRQEFLLSRLWVPQQQVV